MLFINIRNGKPVEKRGRKAKGLKSRSRDHDSPVTEDKIILTIFVSLVI